MTQQNNVLMTRISLFVITALSVIAILGFALSARAATLNRQLQRGMSGSDVSALQEFLAQDSSIYPSGLVTGYFGPLTSAAVSNFQIRNGISAAGRVGPATLPVLNAQIDGGISTGGKAAPAIFGVGVSTSANTASVTWNTNENARGVVYYSTSPLIATENAVTVDVSGNTAMTDTTYRANQNVAINNLQPHTVYYYLIYTTDVDGNVSVTWPSSFQTTN